ncbi:ketopantoate reductase family protein [Desulforhopalus sp. IMCC35007]|uniref:ketopantoate reductase family protein n=1 Tax=Desulforhopalus sp. IMCC35007 TaxID=2569543 RepID=UPI00145F53B6|nr:ketopantoate reductase family protein [Desulforhopalus sp. IMCC35007]
MHYVLVGPGALGCLLACTAAKGLGNADTLTILDYNSERAKQITAKGVLYQEGKTASSFAVNAVSDPNQLSPVDVVLLCVKSYDIKSCLDFCTPFLSEQTLLIFMQNGISHLACEAALHGAAAAYGTTTEGATILGHGHVLHAGRGTTFLGFLNTPASHFNTLLQATNDLFERGGIESHLTSAILTKLWGKLFVNVGINALTATLDCKNGELLTLPGASERMENAIQEAIKVANAKKIEIIGNPVEAARSVCQKTAGNVSSMLQDVRKKRKTEIDAINGAVVAFGKKLGIDTPQNKRLMQQVKDIERTYTQQAHS